jgi:hypothetical protein
MQEKFIQIATKKPGGSAPPTRTHYAKEVAVLRLAPDWLNALQAFAYRVQNEKLTGQITDLHE